MKSTLRADQASQEGSTAQDSARDLMGLRLLVVEDVGMVAIALKSMLEELGCVVVGTAARLHEAEESARTELLDGVLLDLNLGGQYSYPVIDILRERDIPFILMSGYDVGQLRPELIDEPNMQKPFERDALEEMMSRVFAAKRRLRGTEEEWKKAMAETGDVADRPVQPKSRGEIERAVCQGMCRFEQEYIGRGPEDVRAHLIKEVLVVRLLGVLTAAERHLVESSSPEHGRDLLKRVRTSLIEGARPQVESMIQLITGVKVVSLHHDISTETGEEVIVFTLDEPPVYRELKVR